MLTRGGKGRETNRKRKKTKMMMIIIIFMAVKKEEGDDENDDDDENDVDDDEAGLYTGMAARVATLPCAEALALGPQHLVCKGYKSVSGFSCPRMTLSHAATASATQRKPTVPWRS